MVCSHLQATAPGLLACSAKGDSSKSNMSSNVFAWWPRLVRCSRPPSSSSTKETGLDRKTIRAILNGKKVKASTLAKVVIGLQQE